MKNNIVRVAKKTNYTVIDNTALQDNRLSWKAKGMMAYMLSLPDDWIFYMEELQKHATDGESSFKSGFNELKELGYVERIRKQKSDGTFKWETIVHEKPLTDIPLVEKPQVEKPRVDNRPLLSTNKLSTNKLSTNSIIVSDENAVHKKIIDYLNYKTKKRYKYDSKSNQKYINGRISEGYDFDDFKQVINIKVEEWIGTKMEQYLRPSTLFNNEKFEAYLNQNTRIKKEKEEDSSVKYDYGF